MQLRRQAQRIQRRVLFAALARHLIPDVRPQVTEHGHFAAGNIVCHRHARQLHNAALNRVHQGKVAHCPREQSAFYVAGAAQEERRCRKINHALHANFSVDCLQAGDPYARGGSILFCLSHRVAAVIAGQLDKIISSIVQLLLAVTVVRLVIQHQNVFDAHQFRHYALQHLPVTFHSLQVRAAALQQPPAALGNIKPLAVHKRVVICNQNFGFLQVRQHVGRHQLAAAIVAVRIVGLQHAQPVFDGQSGRHHQKSARKQFALRMLCSIHRLPRNQHCHHGGLAGACGKL